MDESEFLRRLPKVELHCHLEGAIRPVTAFELARKHHVELPADEPGALYDYDNLVDFLKVYVAVSQSIVVVSRPLNGSQIARTISKLSCDIAWTVSRLRLVPPKDGAVAVFQSTYASVLLLLAEGVA